MWPNLISFVFESLITYICNKMLSKLSIFQRTKKSRRFRPCPSGPTIHFSFFYVPKQNPNRIREKEQSPRIIQIVSKKFWLCSKIFLCFLKIQPNSKACVFYFIETFSYLYFLLHKIGQFKSQASNIAFLLDLAQMSDLDFGLIQQCRIRPFHESFNGADAIGCEV